MDTTEHGAEAGSDGEIEIDGRVRIRRTELVFSPLRSGGPGGQNVNKVSNGVELRWNLAGSGALSEGQKALVRLRLGRRVTAAGELLLRAVEFRERPRNVEAAVRRLQELLGAALRQAPKRRPTGPTRGSKRRRREAKARRADLKSSRRVGPDE